MLSGILDFVSGYFTISNEKSSRLSKILVRNFPIQLKYQFRGNDRIYQLNFPDCMLFQEDKSTSRIWYINQSKFIDIWTSLIHRYINQLNSSIYQPVEFNISTSRIWYINQSKLIDIWNSWIHRYINQSNSYLFKIYAKWWINFKVNKDESSIGAEEKIKIK